MAEDYEYTVLKDERIFGYVHIDKVGGGTVGKVYYGEGWRVVLEIRGEIVIDTNFNPGPGAFSHEKVADRLWKTLSTNESYQKLFTDPTKETHFAVSVPSGRGCIACGAYFRVPPHSGSWQAVSGGRCPGIVACVHGERALAAHSCKSFDGRGTCMHTIHCCICDLCTGKVEGLYQELTGQKEFKEVGTIKSDDILGIDMDTGLLVTKADAEKAKGGIDWKSLLTSGQVKMPSSHPSFQGVLPASVQRMRQAAIDKFNASIVASLRQQQAASTTKVTPAIKNAWRCTLCDVDVEFDSPIGQPREMGCDGTLTRRHNWIPVFPHSQPEWYCNSCHLVTRSENRPSPGPVSCNKGPGSRHNWIQQADEDDIPF